MSLFDTQTNIKKDFTVGDFYEINVTNSGMTGTLEDNAKKVFKSGVTLGDVVCDIKETPIETFNKIFKYPLEKYICFSKDYKYGLNWIGMWKLKRFLKKWVKRKYLSGYNEPDCDTLHNPNNINDYHYYHYHSSWSFPWDIFIAIYNGEVIESATGACFWFFFKRK